MNNAVSRTVRSYFRATSLHGFKYLFAAHKKDRVLWLVFCAASACCAGFLAQTLWHRFARAPALLVLRSSDADARGGMPTLAVCLPAAAVARAVIENAYIHTPHVLSTGERNETLAAALSDLFRLRSPAPALLARVQSVLGGGTGAGLRARALAATPPCAALLLACRADAEPSPGLIHKYLTKLGVCCIIGTKRRDGILNAATKLEIAWAYPFKDMDGYLLATSFAGRGWVPTAALRPGRAYSAHVRYRALAPDAAAAPAAQAGCVADPDYVQLDCVEETERACGCRDPTQTFLNEGRDAPRPDCALTDLRCLRDYDAVAMRSCAPACDSVTNSMSLKEAPLQALEYTLDPFYAKVEAGAALVLTAEVSSIGSDVFLRRPTENWLTLMSSLGGVFNMFLGVGLFSALELVYQLVVRLPAALRAASEYHAPTPP